MSNVYEGKEPYIFISYAHRDTDLVMPVIEGLKMRGFRVWYDDNIYGGSDWREELALHIEQCGCFVPFFSENYFASENCIQELDYALGCKKPMTPVYLTNCTLERKYKFQLISTQFIQRNKWKKPEDILNRLGVSEVVVRCKEGVHDEAKLKAEIDEQKKKNDDRQVAALRRKAAREEKRAEEERRRQERLQNEQKAASKKKGGCGCWFWVMVMLAIAGWLAYRWLCYSEDNFFFSVQAKYEDSSAYVTYLDVEVENYSLLDISEVQGRLKIYNADDVCLLSLNYTLTSDLKANQSTIFDLDFDESDTNHFEELYNAALEELKVTFQLSSITFENGKQKEYKNSYEQVLCDVVPLDEVTPSVSSTTTTAPPTTAQTNFDGEFITDPVPDYVRWQFDSAMAAFAEVDVYSATAESDFTDVSVMFDAIWYEFQQSDILQEEMYVQALTYKAYDEYVKAYIMFGWLANISYKDSQSHMDTCYQLVQSGLY